MSHTYNPKFHKDGSITYWHDKKGMWIHRVHPVTITKTLMNTWRAKDRKAWALCMLKRGFIKRGDTWIPAQEMKSV